MEECLPFLRPSILVIYLPSAVAWDYGVLLLTKQKEC